MSTMVFKQTFWLGAIYLLLFLLKVFGLFSPDSYRLSLPAIILPHVWVVS